MIDTLAAATPNAAEAAMNIQANPSVDDGTQACRLCGGGTVFQFSKQILGRHAVRYWRCDDCGSLETDPPHWLAEAYRSVHSFGDTGMVARTWAMAQTASLLLRLAGVGPATPCIDWGGGNGLFCRMMRDQGYDFVNDDKYAEPFYCAGFTRQDSGLAKSDVVTSFEVFEHLPDPGTELAAILALEPKLWLFSTQLYARQDDNWSYLSPDIGRHVFFYSPAALDRFAARHGYRFLRGRDMHLMVKNSGHRYLRGPLARYAVARLLAGSKPAVLGATAHFLARQRGAWRHWRADSALARQARGCSRDMRPTLAFVSLWDAADRNRESGYAYSMRAQLQKCFDVVDVFPLGLPGEKLLLPLRAAYKLRGQYYHPMREPAVLKALARRIENRLRGVRPQAVFSPSSIPMTFVDPRWPAMFAADQVFGDFLETYIRAPARRFARLGHAQEQRALRLARRASYPSHWAARSAVARHGADPARIDVIPWGANLPQELAEDEVAAAIAARPMKSCHLAFIGRDWQRKGGPLLAQTVRILNDTGLPATATVIGCSPPGLAEQHFEIHPFLDKGRPEHFAILARTLLQSHFLFLPSRAEAYGQAFCEAAAFGLPSIGSAVGGIPTIIRDGETGFVAPLDTTPAQFAALIREAMADPARYARMAAAARRDYRERLNWNSFGMRLADALMTIV